MIKKLFRNYFIISLSFSTTTKMQPIRKITKFNGMIRILGQNPGVMTLQGTNSYLIGNGKNRLLFDTSDSDKEDYIQLLEQVLKEENALIKDVIISHWHHDHIGALKNIRSKKLIDDNCRVWKFPRTEAEEDFNSMGLLQLRDEQEFIIDDVVLKIYLTPGHTTDHAILYDAKKNQLYSGDCILGEGTAVFEDLYDYIRSLEKILELKPEVILPGHGNVIYNAVEKIKYYIEHRNERERQILAALKSTDRLTLMGIVEIVYKETPKNLWIAASINVNHHLTKLRKEGKVEEEIQDNETIWRILSANNKL